jgi:hypothetical protein
MSLPAPVPAVPVPATVSDAVAMAQAALAWPAGADAAALWRSLFQLTGIRVALPPVLG